MSKRTYHPDRGDIIHLSMDPSTGRELAGPHYALVLSPLVYNRPQGLMIAAPMTSHYHQNPYQLEAPRGIVLPGGKELRGWVYTDQIKSFDYRERNAVFLVKAPAEFLEDALHLTLTLLNPIPR